MTTSSEPPAAELADVVKEYVVSWRGERMRALDHVTLTVERGEVFGLIGPNGSGKSTALKALLGLVAPDAGRCRIFGQPAGSAAARRAVGYVPDAPRFPTRLSARELVRFQARLAELPRPRLDVQVSDVLAAVGLRGVADRPVKGFSRGMLQRLGLAQALVREPDLLVLDEPTSGLDPAGAAEMTALLARLRVRGVAILVASHDLPWLEELCDRVAFIDHGSVVLAGTLAELRAGEDRRLVLDRLGPKEREDLENGCAERGRMLHGVADTVSSLERAYLERFSGRPDL